MYLKELYKHSKLLFLAIVMFATLQLADNLKHAIAASPFYSYGMYSQVIEPDSTYEIPEIFVNGEQLQTKDFTPMRWDYISYPVSLYYGQKSWNSRLWQQDIQRLLPFTDSAKFFNSLSEQDFDQWYKAHIKTMLGRETDSATILFSTYSFDGKTLHKIKSVPAHEQ